MRTSHFHRKSTKQSFETITYGGPREYMRSSDHFWDHRSWPDVFGPLSRLPSWSLINIVRSGGYGGSLVNILRSWGCQSVSSQYCVAMGLLGWSLLDIVRLRGWWHGLFVLWGRHEVGRRVSFQYCTRTVSGQYCKALRWVGWSLIKLVRSRSLCDCLFSILWGHEAARRASGQCGEATRLMGWLVNHLQEDGVHPRLQTRFTHRRREKRADSKILEFTV